MVCYAAPFLSHKRGLWERQMWWKVLWQQYTMQSPWPDRVPFLGVQISWQRWRHGPSWFGILTYWHLVKASFAVRENSCSYWWISTIFFHLRKWSIWHDSACCHTCCLSVTEKLSNVQPVWSGCDTGIAFQRGGWSWKLLEQTKRTEERTRKIPAQPTHFVTLGSSSQQLCRFNQNFLWNSS